MSKHVSLGTVDIDMLDRAIKDLEIHCPSSKGKMELQRLFRDAVANLDHPAGFAAADLYNSDDIEVGSNPAISEGEDGAFVSAWVWVPKEDWGTLDAPKL